VIDSAKGIAAVRGGLVAAIPTTLSGAPMTAIHRLPAGRQAEAGVRPSLVIAYTEAMTSAPEEQLRATAMNALAHGAESLYTPLADERSREAALRGAGMIARSLDQAPGRRNRSDLALGALLCAIAVDRAGIALHHVLGQTTVRVLGTPHAETYAALLPETMAAMRERAPERIEALASALGTDPAGLHDRIADLAGHRHLGELGAHESRVADRPRLERPDRLEQAVPVWYVVLPGELPRGQRRRVLGGVADQRPLAAHRGLLG
jgi:alcohol dehydrogenase class IV